MIDRKLILETLAKMQKYFGKILIADVIDIYLDHLEKMPEDKFKAASVKLLADFQPTSTVPFPLIRDFLEQAGLDGKSRSVNIVSIVRKKIESTGQYESVDFGDRFIHSVIQRYGGWQEMVLNNTDEWWSLHERNFIAAYDAAKRAGMEGPERLIGLHEAENKFNGIAPELFISRGLSPAVGGYAVTPGQKIEKPEPLKIDSPKTPYKDMTTKEKLKALAEVKP